MESKNYLKTQLRMMIWMGLSRPLVSHPIVNALFVIRAIFAVVIYVTMMIGCIAHMKIVNKYNLLLSSVNVLQLVIYFTGMLQFSYYQIKNKAVHCLIIKIREAFRFSSNTGHFTMEEPVRLDTRRSIGWTVFVNLAMMCSFALAISYGDDPVPVWAPVNLRESPYYETDVLLQFTALFTLGMHGSCFGSFYISVMSLFKYQFDMLSCSLEHMAPLAVLRSQRRIHGKNEETSGPITLEKVASNSVDSEMKMSRKCECCTEEFRRFFATFERRRLENSLTELEIRIYEEEVFDTLKDCIIHYQNIVEFGDQVRDFFGPILLIRFILSAIVQCFTMYNLSKLTAEKDFNSMDMRIISLAEYYLMAFGEMCIFCFIADHLLRSSTLIPDMVYEWLPWYGGSVTKKFLSTFKIFHLRVMKPTCLRTPFYVVSLAILTTMIRASFSFYTLLRKLQ